MDIPIRIGGLVHHISIFCYAIATSSRQSHSETILNWGLLPSLKASVVRGLGVGFSVEGGMRPRWSIDIQIDLMALKSTNYGRA